VTIRSGAALDGNVVARAINVEKGGTFTGQLIIGRQTLEQGELLPQLEMKALPTADTKRRRANYPVGLPATS
jgi:cytoskeletal protein CcmA (bactofilin family)